MSAPAPATSVQAVVARVLWECDEGAGWNMSTETRDDYDQRAAAVVAALGLEQVGWKQVDSSFLLIPTEPRASAVEWEPVFRLGATDG